MGVFTPEGRLVPAMADKYRQICRFVELVADVVGEGPRDGRPFRAVDFGCGKSYLTFIVYHYLTVVRGLSVEMTGLDLKADVIAHCNEAARRFGYGGLHFETGDVSGYAMATPADLVMTLHAATPRPTMRWPTPCAAAPATSSLSRAASMSSMARCTLTSWRRSVATASSRSVWRRC